MTGNISRGLLIIAFLPFAGPALSQTDTPTPTVTPTPTPFPWPMFRHDAGRTGRSDKAGPVLPRLLWTYATDGAVSSSPAIGSDGDLYVGSADGRLFGFDSSGQAVAAPYSTDGSVLSSPLIISYPAVSTSHVYIGSNDNNIYSLDLDLMMNWSYAAADYITSSPVGDQADLIYVGSFDRNLYALSSSGSLIWTYSGGDRFESSPAVDSSGNIYIGCDDARLYAVISGGSLRWTYTTTDRIASSPMIGSDGRVYAGSDDFRLYCLNSSGGLAWTFATGGAVRGSAAEGLDGSIFAPSLDGKLYALNTDGTLGWTFSAADKISSSPAVDSAGKIYFGSDDTALYILDPDGTLFWSMTAAGMIASSPAIGEGGAICFGADDGQVYCLYSESTPTPTPTPAWVPYLSLEVLPRATAIESPLVTPTPHAFQPGDSVVLEWEVAPDAYGFRDVPLDVYVGARLDGLSQGMVTLGELTSGTDTLFIFNSRLEPFRYDPANVNPTYRYAILPLPDTGATSGTLVFKVPPNAQGDWVFAAAFLYHNTGVFVVPAPTPNVAVSNTFYLLR